MSFNIAIDGPAGAGKSTIAKELAKELSFLYVDTGAMYRAIAYDILARGIAPEDADAVAGACPDIHVSLAYEDGAQRVYVNGTDISEEIRREEVGNAASVVSAYPAVREALFSLQRSIAAEHDVVMDGRDIGTCILPNAQLKIFLTASVQTRARRRCLELTGRGETPDPEQIERDLLERDERDTQRAAAPLRAAEDAVTVDSSDLTIEQVVDVIKRLYEERK